MCVVTVQTGRGVFVAGTARNVGAACRAVRRDGRRFLTLDELLRVGMTNPWADAARIRQG
jgi:hypothetical protein